MNPYKFFEKYNLERKLYFARTNFTTIFSLLFLIIVKYYHDPVDVVDEFSYL